MSSLPISDRELLQQRAAALARPLERAQQRGLPLVVFALANTGLAIELRFLREAVRVPQLTMLPGAPLVQGLALLRGEVLPVFLLAPLLGLAQPPVRPGSRLLVLGEHLPELGVVVDEIVGAAFFAESELSALPESTAPTSLCRGLMPDGTLLLDGARLLADPRWRAGP